MDPEAILLMIQLTDLKHVRIDMNVRAIIALKDQTDAPHLGEGARCTIRTFDGKALAVLETCDEVRKRIAAARQ